MQIWIFATISDLSSYLLSQQNYKSQIIVVESLNTTCLPHENMTFWKIKKISADLNIIALSSWLLTLKNIIKFLNTDWLTHLSISSPLVPPHGWAAPFTAPSQNVKRDAEQSRSQVFFINLPFQGSLIFSGAEQTKGQKEAGIGRKYQKQQRNISSQYLLLTFLFQIRKTSLNELSWFKFFWLFPNPVPLSISLQLPSLCNKCTY